MALIQCRITAKFLVQNKKQISAKKAENLQILRSIPFNNNFSVNMLSLCIKFATNLTIKNLFYNVCRPFV